MFRYGLVIGASLMLASCATTPTAFRGDFADVQQTQAVLPAMVGKNVLWGGLVVGTRATDQGQCLEVAAFPLDRYTSRPIPEEGIVRTLMQSDDYSWTRRGYRARFLACDGIRLDDDALDEGAVITLTGTLRAPQLFEVSAASCDDTYHAVPKWSPHYSGTPHVMADGSCIVAIPTLEVGYAQRWKDLPHLYPFGPNGY